MEKHGLIGEIADFQVLHLRNWRDISFGLLKQCFAIVIDESMLEKDIIGFFKRVTIYNGISIIVTSFNKNYKNLLETITLRIIHEKNKPSEARKDHVLVKLTEDTVLDTEDRILIKGGRVIVLSSLEFRILKTLIEHSGKICSSEKLIDLVWGFDETVGTDNLYVYIHKLREKIEANPNKPKIIKTRRGQGYFLCLETQVEVELTD
ncbi:winged helix-turn-helix domain-containing protein [Cytobacillus firmus]|uniref:winged helix-turn-helix domain-containing protein n=1 Tax=Cytobacillus firmus TaxID=1399 RepID=UPI00384C02A0